MRVVSQKDLLHVAILDNQNILGTTKPSLVVTPEAIWCQSKFSACDLYMSGTTELAFFEHCLK